jgi:hypothetical protein
MLIEKAFAIEAPPAAIWEALWAELGSGQRETFEVEDSHWPRTLRVRVKLTGIPCLLTYRIEPRGAGAEVSATLEPLGFLFGIYQMVTFGHLKRNYEIILVLGLANLKKALEPASEPPATEGLAPEDGPAGG